MFSARVIKQWSYASGFLLLIIIVISLVTLAVTKQNIAAPTPSPSLSVYLPIKVEHVDVVKHNNIVDVVARLQNPNAHAGIASLPVKFIFLDTNGKVLATRDEVSYILPGNIQYVTTLGVQVSGTVDTVKLEIPSDNVFTNIPNSLKLPTYNSFLYDRTIKKIGDAEMEEQQGIITNNSTFDFQRVEVTAIAFDKDSHVVGVGTTFLGALKVNEQREFLTQWFRPSTPTERVIVFPITNMFKEENIMRVIGDSSLIK